MVEIMKSDMDDDGVATEGARSERAGLVEGLLCHSRGYGRLRCGYREVQDDELAWWKDCCASRLHNESK